MRSEVQVLPGPRRKKSSGRRAALFFSQGQAWDSKTRGLGPDVTGRIIQRGIGAAGSASALQAEGRRFEPGMLHNHNESPGITRFRGFSFASHRVVGRVVFCYYRPLLSRHGWLGSLVEGLKVSMVLLLHGRKRSLAVPLASVFCQSY